MAMLRIPRVKGYRKGNRSKRKGSSPQSSACKPGIWLNQKKWCKDWGQKGKGEHSILRPLIPKTGDVPYNKPLSVETKCVIGITKRALRPGKGDRPSTRHRTRGGKGFVQREVVRDRIDKCKCYNKITGSPVKGWLLGTIRANWGRQTKKGNPAISGQNPRHKGV